MSAKVASHCKEHPESLTTKGGEVSRSDAQKSSQNLSPEKLKVLLLQGKISQGEYLHKLRSFNSVLADTTLKEGKRSSVQAIAVHTIDSTNSHSPQSLNAHHAESPPSSSSMSHKAHGETDSGKARELKQVAERLQKREQFDRVVISTIFENDNREVQRAHQERETDKREEEKLLKEQKKEDTKFTPEDILKKVFDEHEMGVTESMAQKLEDTHVTKQSFHPIFQTLKKLIFKLKQH